MTARGRERDRLIQTLSTVGSTPVVYVVREVWHPPTDVYETEQAIRVCVEIAGVERDDLDVSLADGELTVRGHRGSIVHGYTAVHRLEMHYGDFETTMTIPARVAEAEIEAVYENGVLCVTLPKERPRRVTVESAD